MPSFPSTIWAPKGPPGDQGPPGPAGPIGPPGPEGSAVDAELRAKLANPAEGTAIVYRNGIYGVETAEAALARHELIGQEGGIADYQGINPGYARLILAGYDSLTAGAGGTSWNTYFRKIMRGQLDYGGPGLQLFSGEISSAEGASFGVSGLNAIVENGPFFTYSIGGFGVYALAAPGNAFLNWKPSGAWVTAKVFYLKQPGGGSFRIGTTAELNADKILVSTASSVYELGSVDVSIGKGAAGQTLAATEGTGLICLFGALFVNSDTGFMFGTIAKGGRKLSDVAAQDSTLRKQWFAALQPSHLLMNGGANDKDLRTGPEHYADLATIISDVQLSSAVTNIVVIQHNHISGEASTYIPAQALAKIQVAKDKGTGYFDIRRLLGSYAAANANGYMLDGVHPSLKANKFIAAYNAVKLGFAGNSADPGEAPYGGGGGGAVIQRAGVLTTKAFNANNGVKTAFYTLGMIAGFPAATIRLTITSNRVGTRLNTTKEVLVSIGNSNLTNAVTGTTVPAVVSSIQDASGASNSGNFVIEADIVASKCVLSITPSNYNSAVTVEGVFAVPYNTVAGQAIFEN